MPASSSRSLPTACQAQPNTGDSAVPSPQADRKCARQAAGHTRQFLGSAEGARVLAPWHVPAQSGRTAQVLRA
eukprot:2866027-Alexandrium_andersonii.AAC.1